MEMNEKEPVTMAMCQQYIEEVKKTLRKGLFQLVVWEQMEISVKQEYKLLKWNITKP